MGLRVRRRFGSSRVCFLFETPQIDPMPGSLAPLQCWHGRFTREACCDLTHGSEGSRACWSGQFQYISCCLGESTPSSSSASCWQGAYDAATCCDLQEGPHGRDACWSQGYTFERCCADSQHSVREADRWLRDWAAGAETEYVTERRLRR